MVASFLCVTWHVCADITLRITDLDGQPLKRAQVGRPFRIEATVKDINDIASTPRIKGLEAFTIGQTGTQIYSVNGNQTVRYFFDATARELGTYTVGPAEYPRPKMQSNVLEVVVDQIEVADTSMRAAQGARKKRDAQETVYMHLSTDKDRATVGEKVACTLRFYSADEKVGIRNIFAQESNDFKTIGSHVTQQGTEKIDGKDYSFVEWQWDMYPNKSGSITVPAYGINYEREVPRDDFWGGMGRFFGNRVEQKRVYSNSLTLEVDPLPKTNKLVQGIGSFSYIHLSAQPAVAKQGEGVIITVEIAGDGDLDAIDFPALQNVSDSLRSYQSNQTVIPATQPGDIAKKKIEFVIQGLKTGSFEIPSQKFHYFDVVRKKYKTLESAPLTLTIMPGTKKQPVKTANGEADAQAQHDGTSIKPLHSSFTSPFHRMPALPWYIFLILAGLPFLYLAYVTLAFLIRKKLRKKAPLNRSKQAFGLARKRLHKEQTEGRSEKIYTVFIELFADRFNSSLSVISSDFMHQQIADRLDERKIGEWRMFFDAISQRAFGAKTDKEYDNQLFKQAEQWIQTLEKHL